MLLRLACLSVANAFALPRLPPTSVRDEDTEILALRHQITVLERSCSGIEIFSSAATLPSLAQAPGRPRTVRSIHLLVLCLAQDDLLWGYRRIHDELLVPGIKVVVSTVWQILEDAGTVPRPPRTG